MSNNTEQPTEEILDYKEKKEKKKRIVSDKQKAQGIKNLKKYHEDKKIKKVAEQILQEREKTTAPPPPQEVHHKPKPEKLKFDSDEEIDIDEIINRKLNKNKHKDDNDDYTKILKEELTDLKTKMQHVAERTEKLYQMKKMKYKEPKKEVMPQPIIIDNGKNTSKENKSKNQQLMELLRNNNISYAH